MMPHVLTRSLDRSATVFLLAVAGLGVLIPRTRAWAGIGLVLLYIAVFPANVYMAIEPVAVDGVVPERWLVWARLPFQPVFMWVAWWCTRPPKKT